MSGIGVGGEMNAGRPPKAGRYHGTAKYSRYSEIVPASTVECGANILNEIMKRNLQVEAMGLENIVLWASQ